MKIDFWTLSPCLYSSLLLPTFLQATFLFLKALKELDKRRSILRATHFELVVDGEVGHTADVLLDGVLHLLVDFWSSLATLEPFLGFLLFRERARAINIAAAKVRNSDAWSFGWAKKEKDAEEDSC